jgi:uncharacterized protein YraI
MSGIDETLAMPERSSALRFCSWWAREQETTMIHPKQVVCAAGFLFLSTGLAAAAPALVATDLNVRSGEGTGYPVMAVMPAGAVVDVSGCGNGWCYVSEYGGFASASYLDVGGVGYSSARPTYVAPPVAVVVPGPVYREPYYGNSGRFVRRGVRQFQRELRRDDRRDARQEWRQNRREARQEDRREARQDSRQERRQDRRESRAQQ